MHTAAFRKSEKLSAFRSILSYLVTAAHHSATVLKYEPAIIGKGRTPMSIYCA